MWRVPPLPSPTLSGMIHSKSLSMRAARAESFLFRTKSIGKFIQKAEISRPSPINPLKNVYFLARNYAEADARRSYCEKCPFIGLAKTKRTFGELSAFSLATFLSDVSHRAGMCKRRWKQNPQTPPPMGTLSFFSSLPHFPIHASYAFCVLAFEGARQAQAFFLSWHRVSLYSVFLILPQRGINGGFAEFSLLRD